MFQLKYLPIGDPEAEAFSSLLATYLPAEFIRENGIRAATDKMLRALDELASPEFVTKRAKFFNIANEDLLAERVLLREGSRVVTAGLRFRKLDVNFPFVHVCANFPLSDQDLAKIKALAAEAFAPICLKGITVRLSPNFFFTEGAEKWSHTLFGHTTGLPELTLPPEFRTQWGEAITFYSEYKAEYEKFFELQPEKQAYLREEDEDDLKRAAENGLLMSVWDENGWAGVIAARAKDLYGLPCAYIFEIFLVGRARGRGLGRPMQAQFLTGIAGRFSHVFGHINDTNQSSLKTATSLGRKVIESEYFFPMQ